MMKAYQQRRVQVAVNAVYRTTALILRSLGVTEEQVEAACQTLSSQAPEKFSRKVSMEVFAGGQGVADTYQQKDADSLAASKKDAVQRTRVAHLRKQYEGHSKTASGDQGSRLAGRQEDPVDGAASVKP